MAAMMVMKLSLSRGTYAGTGNFNLNFRGKAVTLRAEILRIMGPAQGAPPPDYKEIGSELVHAGNGRINDFSGVWIK